MSEVQPMTFTLHSDGRLFVDQFPDTIEISEAAFVAAKPERLERKDDRVVLRTDNGTAAYLIESYDPNRCVVTCSRLWVRDFQEVPS